MIVCSLTINWFPIQMFGKHSFVFWAFCACFLSNNHMCGVQYGSDDQNEWLDGWMNGGPFST